MAYLADKVYTWQGMLNGKTVNFARLASSWAEVERALVALGWHSLKPHKDFRHTMELHQCTNPLYAFAKEQNRRIVYRVINAQATNSADAFKLLERNS